MFQQIFPAWRVNRSYSRMLEHAQLTRHDTTTKFIQVVVTSLCNVVISSFPDNMFYHVWTMLFIYHDGFKNVVQVCSFIKPCAIQVLRINKPREAHEPFKFQTWAFVSFHQPRTFEEKQTTDLVSRYFEYSVIFRGLKTGQSFGKQVQYRKENSLPWDKLAVHERPFRIYMIWLVHD